MSEESRAGSNILIVDDNPANLKVLEDMLRQEGYEVRSFPRGRLALEAAKRNLPDLILLDINMPEMNGYDVCAQLKSTEETASIPVIFLSGLDATEDKVKAFQAGAVDYITKPLRFHEVRARVKTHLTLHGLQLALKRHNERLEETVVARTEELAQANARLTVLDQSKNDFLRLISHEFRTPLNGLFGVGELLLDEMSSSAEHNELKEMFDQSRRRILGMLDDALLLTHIDVNGENLTATQASLCTVLSRVMERSAEFAASRHVKLSLQPAEFGLVQGDEDLLVRAFHALLETAIKFSESDGVVRLEYRVIDGLPGITIESYGKTIPSAVLEKFFDIFSIGESVTPGGNLGLGPSVACRILSLFGSWVRVANLDHPPGIRLTVVFSGTVPVASRGLKVGEDVAVGLAK